jgi:LemA protein
MSSSLWLVFVVASLLAFWTLGAYNRLMGLRNRINRAWSKLDEALQQRSQAAQPLLAALQEPLASEAGALQATHAALANAAQAATQMGTRPSLAPHAQAWVAAEANLAAAAARLFALLDQHPQAREVLTVPTVPACAAQWKDADQRLSFARQVFNDAAASYNAACVVFPTRLLVRLFQFSPAGQL